VVSLAIDHSTVAMEDFLLRNAKRSPTAINAMRLLRNSIECEPTHPKSWYRFGFLLRRQARLDDAAVIALEHAVELKPSSAGPALSELTLLHLDRLIRAEDETAEAEFARRAKRAHAEALKLNPAIALHSLKAAYGNHAESGSFSDVLAHAMELRLTRRAKADEEHKASLARRDRQKAINERERRVQPKDYDVEVQVCEESRAHRDVLRLKGEDGAADEVNERLEAELDGRTLPAPIYQMPPRPRIE
jgi:tetratricopeptide (TPR) repeat protein